MGLLLVLLTLSVIIYEDFKFRAIHWWCIPLMMIGVCLIQVVNWKFFLFNMGFIIFQITFLSLYFSIKEKRWINITESYLGLGDILFLIPLALLFSPFHLILFITLSSLLIVMVTVLINIRQRKMATIPLAGFQSIFLIFILLGSQLYNYDLATDLGLQNYFLQ